MGRPLVVLMLVAVVLITVPWWWGGGLAPLPARLVAGEPLLRDALGLAASVDKASAQGRVDALRELVTEGCWQRLTATLAKVDRIPDGRTLREQGAWVGAPPAAALLAAGGRGEQLLVLLDGAPGGIVALRFTRVDGALRFDERIEYPVEENGDRQALAERVLAIFGGPG